MDTAGDPSRGTHGRGEPAARPAGAPGWEVGVGVALLAIVVGNVVHWALATKAGVGQMWAWAASVLAAACCGAAAARALRRRRPPAA